MIDDLEALGSTRTERRVWRRLKVFLAVGATTVAGTTTVVGWTYKNHSDLAVHVAKDDGRDEHTRRDLEYIKEAVDAIWADVRQMERAQCRANPKACSDGRR